MPVNGSITLHCEAQVPPFDNYTQSGLQWNIAVGAYTHGQLQIFLNHLLIGNPSILCVHHLLLSENGSTVQCLVTNLLDTWSQIVTIYVVGKMFHLKVL